MAITTTGRTDIEDFFRLSGYLSLKRLNHYPFIVFREEGADIHVEIVDNAEKLVTRYPDETKVMAQWQGQWRSDFFQLTVGDVRQYMMSKV